MQVSSAGSPDQPSTEARRSAKLARAWWQWGQQLYVRIWLAVVLAVAVLTMLVGWAWRFTADPPLRELRVRNTAGEIIGSAQRRAPRPPPIDFDDALPLSSERPSELSPPEGAHGAHPEGMPPDVQSGVLAGEPKAKGLARNFGNGPEFLVTLNDGQIIHIHLPRPPNRSLFSSRP